MTMLTIDAIARALAYDDGKNWLLLSADELEVYRARARVMVVFRLDPAPAKAGRERRRRRR